MPRSTSTSTVAPRPEPTRPRTAAATHARRVARTRRMVLDLVMRFRLVDDDTLFALADAVAEELGSRRRAAAAAVPGVEGAPGAATMR